MDNKESQRHSLHSKYTWKSFIKHNEQNRRKCVNVKKMQYDFTVLEHQLSLITHVQTFLTFQQVLQLPSGLTCGSVQHRRGRQGRVGWLLPGLSGAVRVGEVLPGGAGLSLVAQLHGWLLLKHLHGPPATHQCCCSSRSAVLEGAVVASVFLPYPSLLCGLRRDVFSVTYMEELNWNFKNRRMC